VHAPLRALTARSHGADIEETGFPVVHCVETDACPPWFWRMKKSMSPRLAVDRPSYQFISPDDGADRGGLDLAEPHLRVGARAVENVRERLLETAEYARHLLEHLTRLRSPRLSRSKRGRCRPSSYVRVIISYQALLCDEPGSRGPRADPKAPAFVEGKRGHEVVTPHANGI